MQLFSAVLKSLSKDSEMKGQICMNVEGAPRWFVNCVLSKGTRKIGTKERQIFASQ